MSVPPPSSPPPQPAPSPARGLGVRVRVLVVDDHELVRLGVRQLLAQRGGSFHVAEAATLAQARQQLQDHAVDLLLLDLSLGEDFGLAALPRLREQHPALKVLVLSSLDEALHAERCMRAGADGYVMKSALGATLLQAVDTVLAGQVHLSPELRSRMLRQLAGRDTADARPTLSPREVEVLRLVADGRSTAEIAATLNRSVKTIETHKAALKTKLGADSPARLLRAALAWFGDRA